MRIKKMAVMVAMSAACMTAFADVASDFAQDVGSVQQLGSMVSVGQNGTINIKRDVNGHPETASYQPGDAPNATPNPGESSYYNNPNAMVPAEGTALNKDGAAQALIQNDVSGAKFPIDPTAPSIARNLMIEQDAADIAQGVTDKYVNCQKEPQNCHIVYVNQSCTVQEQANFKCTNTLDPEVVYKPYHFDCNHLVNNNFHEVVVPGPDANNNCVTGVTYFDQGIGNTFEQNGTVNITLPPNVQGTVYMNIRALDSNWDFNPRWDHLGFTETSTTGLPNVSVINPPFSPNAHGNVLWGGAEANFTTPNSQNPVNLSYHYDLNITGGVVHGVFPGILYVQYPNTAYNQEIITNTWVNSCQNSGYLNQCTQVSNQCSEPGGPRQIGHETVTEPCWQYAAQYQCGTNSNSCGSSVKGCDQVGSTCLSSINGICLSYNDSYQCPQNQCTGTGMACGSNFFCISGTCSPTMPSSNQNFGKDDSQMAAVTDGLTQMVGNTSLLAFSGSAMSCREIPVGFLNCCANSGWGKEADLAHCSPEEQKLGDAKQKGLAYEVGSYCSKKVLGFCVQHSQGYCTFSDLLSYDVQIQGRMGQLGINFGSGNNPNCSGISVQQLQDIDFSKIDFSNVVTQVENEANFPNAAAIQSEIEQEVQNEWGGGRKQ